MLLTNITNAVVTISQNTLSNVIVELRVMSASLNKFMQKSAKPTQWGCPSWHPHASGSGRSAWRRALATGWYLQIAIPVLAMADSEGLCCNRKCS